MSKVDLYSLGLKPQYTFETLVVGPHNQMAAAACMEVAKKPGEIYNPLVIFGGPGIGKTHLLHAVAQVMLQANPKLKVKYLSAERYASEVIAAISEDNLMAVRQHFNQLDLFILDDIQFLAESKTTQGEFFHIFNNLQEQNKQVIMASDRSPNQLTMLDQTIRSRLESGLAIDVKVPDAQTRLQILKVKQAAQGLALSDQILQFAATHLTSNVRELEGFLKRLHAYVALSHQELSMNLVQQVIREIIPTGPLPIPESFAPQAPAPLRPIDPSPQPQPAVMAPPPVQIIQPPPAPPVRAIKPPVLPPVIPAEMPAPLRPISPLVKEIVPPIVEKKSPPPPPPPPASIVPVPIIEVPEFPEADVEELPAGSKEIGAVFFYPASKDKELDTVHRKFQEVIKKHKLKFRLKRVFSHGYPCKGKINYTAFVDVCKQNKVPVAIVIGPPPDAMLPEQDFYDLLSVTLDVQGVSLQLVNWAEIEKDYRYLNLALDIALVRSR